MKNSNIAKHLLQLLSLKIGVVFENAFLDDGRISILNVLILEYPDIELKPLDSSIFMYRKEDVIFFLNKIIELESYEPELKQTQQSKTLLDKIIESQKQTIINTSCTHLRYADDKYSVLRLLLNEKGYKLKIMNEEQFVGSYNTGDLFLKDEALEFLNSCMTNYNVDKKSRLDSVE